MRRSEGPAPRRRPGERNAGRFAVQIVLGFGGALALAAVLGLIGLVVLAAVANRSAAKDDAERACEAYASGIKAEAGHRESSVYVATAVEYSARAADANSSYRPLQRAMVALRIDGFTRSTFALVDPACGF